MYNGIERSVFEMNDINKSLFKYEDPLKQNVKITNLKMQVVNNTFAKKFMSEHHYSQTCPNLYYALGFYYNSQILCMVCFGPPSGRLLAQAMIEGGNAQNVCELVRLFAFDWGPKNTESYCIGQSLQWLQNNALDMKLVVSYADPNQGHVGTIYQATNWLYTGQGSRLVDAYEFYVDGAWIHPRSIFSHYGTTDIQKVSKQLGYEVETRLCQHKHRYIYLLGNKRQKRATQKLLKVSIFDYPKQEASI